MWSEKEEKLLPKDALSMANAIAGLAAMHEAVYYRDLFNAFILVLIAVGLDFLDGYTARKSKQGSTKLGRELDSLADAVSFGVAPVIIASTFSSLSGFLLERILFYAASSVYLTCALARLAKFNIQKKAGVYYGLPSPLAALIVSGTSVLLNEWDKLFCRYLQCVPHAIEYVLLIQAFVLVAVGLLMISKFKTRKF